MKVVDIRKLPTAELAAKSTTLREQIAELRRQMRLGEIVNVRDIRTRRKDLARVLTVLGEQLSKEKI